MRFLFVGVASPCIIWFFRQIIGISLQIVGGLLYIFGAILEFVGGFFSWIRTQRIKHHIAKTAGSINGEEVGMERSHIQSINPYDYEEYVAQYLRTKGYTNVYTTKKSGDFGADVIATSPEGMKVCVQCKRFVGSVGVKAIQEIHSAKAYYNCDLAYVFTTGDYTPQAFDLAKRTGVKLYRYVPGASDRIPPSRIGAQSSNTSHSIIGTVVKVIAVLVAIVIIRGVLTNKKHDNNASIAEASSTKQAEIVEDNSTLTLLDEQEVEETIIVDGISYIKKNDHIEVAGLYDYKLTAIIIPETIDELPVTVIQARAFNKEENIRSVTLPNTIETIGEGAFSTCRKMTNINLPKGLQSIGKSAFILCQSLSKIDLPEGIDKIEYGVFCATKITKIDLSNVTTIADNAFQGCTQLSTIILSDRLNTIGDHSFEGCGFAKISIPNGVTSIGKECFRDCSKLKAIELPETLIAIGKRCFYGCKSLVEIRIPSQIQELPDNLLFGFDSALEAIYLPKSCTIPSGDQPFIYCNARIIHY